MSNQDRKKFEIKICDSCSICSTAFYTTKISPYRFVL